MSRQHRATPATLTRVVGSAARALIRARRAAAAPTLLALSLLIACTRHSGAGGTDPGAAPDGTVAAVGVGTAAGVSAGGRQKIPVTFQRPPRAGLALSETATGFALTLGGCASGFSANVTEANTDGLEAYAQDRGCLAQLTQFTLGGRTYVPTASSPFTTWQAGDTAVFDEPGEPGIQPLNVIVLATVHDPIAPGDSVRYGLADVKGGKGHGMLWTTVAESGTLKSGQNAVPSFTIRSVELAAIDAASGAGQYHFVLECTAAIGIADACRSVAFADLDYKLVRDDFGGAPTPAQCAAAFATPGATITLPDDRIAPGVLDATNGGFESATLAGPGDLETNDHMLLLIRSYGASFQYFNVDTILGADFYDTTAPLVARVTTAHPDGAFPAGEVIDIDVSFDEPVTLTGAASTLTLTGGGTATYLSKPAAATLRYRYVVAAGQATAAMDATALVLNGDVIADADGNASAGALPTGAAALAGTAAIAIVTAQPTISGVSTAHANGVFTSGEVIDIDVAFSAAVTASGTGSTLTLSTGGSALYLSRPSPSVLRYRYTVLPGTGTPDLDVTAYELNGDAIRNAAGTDAALTLPSGALSLAGGAAIVIDSIGPTITGVTSTTANGTYGAGQTIVLQVGYSEPVVLTGGGAGVTLLLETGAVDHTATYTGGSGTTTLTFSYTVAAGDASSRLDTHTTAPQLALTGTTPALRDAAGNAASLTVTGTALATSKNIVVDALAPSIVAVTSSAANASYKAGAVLSLQVVYSEPVFLTGTSPGISFLLETGATDHSAVYASGSGTNTLNFNYTVVAGDTAADLDANAVGPQLTLTGTGPALKDAAGNTASLTVAGTSLAANKDLVIDTTAPAITNITSTTANGPYGTGAVIAIQVTYSEPVMLAGTTPGISLKLETGTTDHSAVYVSGSGTTTLNFTYTVVAGDTSADLATHATAPQLSLTGTTPTLRDAAGNAASLTVAGTTLAANKNLVIDTTIPPALTAFTGVACCTVNTLKANAIQLTITYPSVVTDYKVLTIRRVAGATAPIDCTSGNLVTTIPAPFTASSTTRYTDDTGVAGGTFSYRACVADAAGNLRSTNTASNVASAKFSWIFATSASYTGNLNGVAAADAACNAAGSALDGTLNWVALLSTGAMNAAGHAPIRGAVYNRASTPVALAANFAAMWGGAWTAAVGYDESGAAVTGNAWTGSLNSGAVDRGTGATPASNHCGGFASASAGVLGRYGSVTGTGANWAELGTQACNATARIYCVSKTIEPLAGFSAATGTGTDGAINVTVNFPANTTGYAKVEIRRKSGATAPSSLCTTDTLVKSYTTYTSGTFVDPIATNAGAYYSYTACLFDAAGRVAATSTLPVRANSATASHLAFITTATYLGNLGGLAGADAICQAAGRRFDASKTWQAILSDSTTDAATRIPLAGNVRNVNGILLATSKADFFDGTLAAAVSLTEDGVASANRSWTGSTNAGLRKGAGLYCADWSDSTSASNGRRGRHTTTTTHLDEATIACTTASNLYCVSTTPY